MLPGECAEPTAPTAITSTIELDTPLLLLLPLAFGFVAKADICDAGAVCVSASGSSCVIVTDMLVFCVSDGAEFGASASVAASGDVFALSALSWPLSALLALKELFNASICGETASNLCDNDCGCWRTAYWGCG